MSSKEYKYLYDEDRHKYYYEDSSGEQHELQSVTTFKKQFLPPFEAQVVSTCVAKSIMNKHEGLDLQDVKHDVQDEWKMSTDFGEAVHKAVELWEKYGRKPKQAILCKILDGYIEWRDKKYSVTPEKALYDVELGLAGRVDLIARDGDELEIWDIKTSHSLDKKQPGRLKKCMYNVENTKLNQYWIQLAIYAEMLERRGYVVRALKILEPLDDFSWKEYELPMNRELVKELLNCKE